MKTERLVSVDVLRGITIAGMILVNNSGIGESTFYPLTHAEWNGLTPCDLVYPFFLFIMGFTTYLSMGKTNFTLSSGLALKIVRRTLVIFFLGWFIQYVGFALRGDFFPFDHIRYLGVLPRIAICYCVVSFLSVVVDHRWLLPVAVSLLVVYSVVLLTGNGFVNDETNVLYVTDRAWFGEAHLYKHSLIDPIGILSTLSAVAHTIIGFLCAGIVQTEQSDRLTRLLVVGFVLMAVGWLVQFGMPFNKHVWSPSYALVTCGAAASLLAVIAWFDVRPTFFRVFGVNPLFLYVMSEVLSIVLGRFGWKAPVYHFYLDTLGNAYWASLAWASSYVLLLWLVGFVLWKRRIIIKI